MHASPSQGAVPTAPAAPAAAAAAQQAQQARPAPPGQQARQIQSKEQSVAEKVAAMTGQVRSAVEEILASIDDIQASGTEDPNLRQIVQRVFVRSVNEFFTADRESTQLPAGMLPLYRASSQGDKVALVKEFPDRPMPLDHILRRRRSVRDYSNRPMPLELLGEILRAAVGKTGTEDGYGVRDMPLFSYPSMGGLSAFEIGVVVQRVEGLEPGYYVYDQVGANLIPRIRGDLRYAMQQVTFESEWLQFAPAVLVMAHRAEKFEWKYHTRGYRMSHIDMGAALQNLYLSAWASGVGMCAVAGFLDEPINELLGYDGLNTYVSLLAGLGQPAAPLLAQGEK